MQCRLICLNYCEKKNISNKRTCIYYRNITGMSKYNPAYSDSGENTKDPMKSDEKYYAQVVNANVRFLSVFFYAIIH